MEIVNAKISSTFLGVEDHGILTYFLILDYGGTSQGFGTYSLDRFLSKPVGVHDREGTIYGMESVRRILWAVGVNSWEELKEKHVRVKRIGLKAEAIGHIIDEKWFWPEQDLKYLDS